MGKKRTDPNWVKLREALWTRSEGFCEITGMHLDPETFNAHHRRPKQIGGTYRELTDSLPNLLALTPAAHNGGGPLTVHGNPLWSRPRGYLLPGHLGDEAMLITPVLYRQRIWVILDQEGDFGILNDRAQRYLWSTLAGKAIALSATEHPEPRC